VTIKRPIVTSIAEARYLKNLSHFGVEKLIFEKTLEITLPIVKKGIDIPKEYINSKKEPLSIVPCAEAMINIEASTGLAHGIHTNPIPMPMIIPDRKPPDLKR
jgi:hypothetical protein